MEALVRSAQKIAEELSRLSQTKEDVLADADEA
jgi:hypothetical protein